jgi:hypothetical protein
MYRFLISFFSTFERSVSPEFGEEFQNHYQKQWEETDWTKIYLA